MYELKQKKMALKLVEFQENFIIVTFLIKSTENEKLD